MWDEESTSVKGRLRLIAKTTGLAIGGALALLLFIFLTAVGCIPDVRALLDPAPEDDEVVGVIKETSDLAVTTPRVNSGTVLAIPTAAAHEVVVDDWDGRQGEILAGIVERGTSFTISDSAIAGSTPGSHACVQAVAGWSVRSATGGSPWRRSDRVAISSVTHLASSPTRSLGSRLSSRRGDAPMASTLRHHRTSTCSGTPVRA